MVLTQLEITWRNVPITARNQYVVEDKPCRYQSVFIINVFILLNKRLVMSCYTFIQSAYALALIFLFSQLQQKDRVM